MRHRNSRWEGTFSNTQPSTTISAAGAWMALPGDQAAAPTSIPRIRLPSTILLMPMPIATSRIRDYTRWPLSTFAANACTSALAHTSDRESHPGIRLNALHVQVRVKDSAEHSSTTLVNTELNPDPKNAIYYPCEFCWITGDGESTINVPGSKREEGVTSCDC